MSSEIVQIMRVLEISVPIFLLIGLGAVLRYVGMIGPKTQSFLSDFVYLICLPVIIFFVVAPADFPSLMNGPVIAASLIGAVGTIVVFWLLTIRSPSQVRDPLVVSAFFANTAFIGFPLVKSAFPDQGMMYAGLINAVVMPVYYVLSVLLMGADEEGQGRLQSALGSAIRNPVLLAAVAGLAVSGVLHGTNVGDVMRGWPAVPKVVEITRKTADMVGGMGMPLALIAVGAALKWSYLTRHWDLMIIGSVGKLLVGPFLGGMACVYLFPDMPPAAAGVTILLLACPVAVGSYVLSCEMNVDDDYMAGALVLSTILAAVTIPFWLYVLGI